MALGRQVLETAARLGSNPAAQEWARIPRVGQTLEGFYRSQLFALIRDGKIKSAAIKQPGQVRPGMRLVHLPSLRAYIASYVDGAGAGTEVETV